MTDIDVFGDELHPAAYNDDPPPMPDAMWEEAATRNLRRIASLTARQHAVAEAFRKEIDRLTERKDAELATLDKQIEFWSAPLRQLHERLLADDPSRKTIVLPYGTLKSTTYTKPEARVTDKDEFVRWAHVNAPHLLKVSFSPDPKMLASEVEPGHAFHPAHAAAPGDPATVLTDDGEVVPGVVMQVRHPVFSIKLDGEL